jgi:outer membrane receptor protein involved in Fe transport
MHQVRTLLLSSLLLFMRLLQNTLFIFFISFNTLFAFGADETPRIAGKLIDATNNQPLAYATVSLLALPDSVLVDGVITGDDGSFSLAPTLGEYVLKLQFVTYQTKWINVTLDRQNKSSDLGNITISPSQTELEEVVVKGERTQMQLNLDKKVYTVGKDVSSIGGSASDILSNLPSVTVDVEGNVALRGSSNVRILIDGKPSGLVGLSSSDALKQLQGNLIERVEIITNPSAKYEAQGQGGIINLILKKEKRKGINGSFIANTGYPRNHGLGVNMNIRREKVNFFVNYGINFDQAPGVSFTNQKFELPDTTFYTDQDYDRLRGGLSNNVRFGIDIDIAPKTTLTSSFLYRHSKQQNLSDLTFTDFDENRTQVGYSLRQDEENEIDKNLEYSLNLVKDFDRQGQNLTATIQYQDNFENEKSSINQNFGASKNQIERTIFQKIDNIQGEDQLLLQADYIHPFGAQAKFEGGYRSTFRTILNNYLVEEEDVSGTLQPLDTFTFDFTYLENVHAFYGIVSDQSDKFSWQVGLRAEISDIETNQESAITTTQSNKNYNYSNFFPSASLTYKLKMQTQLQLSYSRRINRPRYRDLSPLGSFTNNRSFRLGNPELQPEYTDSYEIGLLQNFKTSSIYYGIYYRETEGAIQRVSPPATAEGFIFSRPENLGLQRAFGVEVNANQDFTDWYRLSGNVNFFRQKIEGSAYGENLDAETVSFTTRLSNNIKIKDKLMMQINFNYQAPVQQSQGRREAITVVDIGLSKDLWDKKGTLSLSAQDLFNSRKYRFETNTSNYSSYSEFQWRRGPQIVLTLNYRLNQELNQRSKSTAPSKGGGEDF